MDYPIRILSQLRPILVGFRKTAGLTQTMMASYLGVTQQTYAQLEANPAVVSVERLFKVLRILDVTLTLSPSSGQSVVSLDAEATALSNPHDSLAADHSSDAAQAPLGNKKREEW
ncbi:MAG: helix-turn-helix transcriptional regulator [Janthinobacterium lividum]